MGSAQLDQVRRARQLHSFQMESILRLGVVVAIFVAIQVGVAPRWRIELVLLSVYLVIALAAAVMAFRATDRSTTAPNVQFGLTFVDIAVVVTYKELSPDGAYVPLLVMTMLPMMIVLYVSRRRAAAVLIVIAAAFAVEVLADPQLVHLYGWGRPTLVVMVYGLLCVTAFLAVHVQTRQVDEIAALSASREELLAEAMAAADRQQRTVSEFIHDGPLQSMLAARQEIVSYRKLAPEQRLAGAVADQRLDLAVANLQDASRQLREATFELHPAVLEHVGLAAAVAELTSVSAARAGISISTDIDYPGTDPVDPLVFAVARELMSNIVRHSEATCARVTLKALDVACLLEVEDDGVGFSEEDAEQQLAGGHIGLASHRARVEAAGGRFAVQRLSPGARISVTLPLRA